MIATEAPVMEQALTAADRCDRCGAQAYVVTEHGDAALLWCAHHFVQHEDKLAGAVLFDARDLLNGRSEEKP